MSWVHTLLGVFSTKKSKECVENMILVGYNKKAMERTNQLWFCVKIWRNGRPDPTRQRGRALKAGGRRNGAGKICQQAISELIWVRLPYWFM